MGNVLNIARDLSAGLVQLTIAQLRFLRAARGSYAIAVAVGDAYALFMALQARTRTVFAGTAKSVFVAPYGPAEERLMRRAAAVFVRDVPTANRLREHGLHAQAANVMADLSVPETPARPAFAGDPLIAIFPGSRETAYGNAGFLFDVFERVREFDPNVRAVLSIAPGLDPRRLARELHRAGTRIEERADPLEPFSVYEGDRELVRAWSGEIGAMIERAVVVLGQAGSANEAAAAAGVPVVSFEGGGWYRRRQAALLGEALCVLPRDLNAGAQELAALLRDEPLRLAMARAGRERLGTPGAAHAIAERIVQLCE